jgi:hypothetical protein
MELKKEKLFNYIKEKLPHNVSFIDEVADVLDISYDASYRRIKGKTALTLNDGLKLSERFKFDLSNLNIDKENNSEKIVVEKTPYIISDNSIGAFFDKSIDEIEKVLNSKNGQVINCAKDFPFYHSDNKTLKKFRLYLFINMLSKDPVIKKLPFSKFTPSKEVLEKYNLFINQYQKVSLVEIWNDTTIDNILNQIQYFFEVGLTTKNETLSISDGLIISLKQIEEQAKNKKRNQSDHSFSLNHNNIISLLNTIFMKSGIKKAVFVPYTNLTYFKITDKNTTTQIEEYIKRQIEFSNNLTGEASIKRRKFFNSMYQKVEKRKLKLFLY